VGRKKWGSPERDGEKRGTFKTTHNKNTPHQQEKEKLGIKNLQVRPKEEKRKSTGEGENLYQKKERGITGNGKRGGSALKRGETRGEKSQGGGGRNLKVDKKKKKKESFRE